MFARRMARCRRCSLSLFGVALFGSVRYYLVPSGEGPCSAFVGLKDLGEYRQMIYVSPAAKRVPHIEPLFEDQSFVLDYGRSSKKLATSDFEPIYDFIQARLGGQIKARVLEIGPGPGWMGIQLAQKHAEFQVIGLDPSDQYLESAIEHAYQEGVSDRVTYVKGDVCQMDDFEDDSFDAVISSQSLHYWNPVQAAFREIKRVIKPGGYFCIEDERRDLEFLGKCSVMIGKFLLTRQVRQSWMRSLDGCYTPAEMRSICDDSALKDQWKLIVRSRLIYLQGQIAE